MRPLRQQEYQEFLKTDFWKELSSTKKEMVGHKCEGCETTENLQCHHKFYRKSWFATRLSDLVVLCDGCHSKVHKALDKPKKRFKRNKPRNRRSRLRGKTRYENYYSSPTGRITGNSKGISIHY